MKKLLFTLGLITALQVYSKQKNHPISFVVLGDIHFDLLEDHDMD